jgi:hypothetical protein
LTLAQVEQRPKQAVILSEVEGSPAKNEILHFVQNDKGKTVPVTLAGVRQRPKQFR